MAREEEGEASESRGLTFDAFGFHLALGGEGGCEGIACGVWISLDDRGFETNFIHSFIECVSVSESECVSE